MNWQQSGMEEEDEEEEETLIPEYKNLICIHAVKGRGGLENLLKGDSKRVARLSLKEQKLENVVRTRSTDIIRLVITNSIHYTISIYSFIIYLFVFGSIMCKVTHDARIL